MGIKEEETSNEEETEIPKKWKLPQAFYVLLVSLLVSLLNVIQLKGIGNESLAWMHSEPFFDNINSSSSKIHHDPLNIVLFYADDWTMKVLGKLNRHVQTPNIDSMADKGMLFTDNCVTTSVCWVSRASLMTGVYASRHRQLLPWSTKNMFELHPWNETMFPLLKSHGYYTGLVGKWHALESQPEISQAFDYKNIYYGKHWEIRRKKKRHVTDLNLEDSLDFLRKRPRDKNFALKVSFFATHAWDNNYPSYQPMNRSQEIWYNGVTIPTPKTATKKHWKELPFFFHHEGPQNEGRQRWRKRFEPEYYQESIKGLYRMATEVDFAIGEIIAELKRQEVYNKTMLIFTTDNGNLHGEHGLAEKWYPFEESIQVPLVIQDPRMPKSKHGTTNDKITLNIDLAPTILGAANIEPSSFFQGDDIAKLYLGPKNTKWREDFFYEYFKGDEVDPVTAKGHDGKFWIDASFALVTKEWKYVYWPEHKYEQLFHRRMDPFDEFDLLKKNSTIPNDVYQPMKARYDSLKLLAQGGKQV